jgi:hypothetical protein
MLGQVELVCWHHFNSRDALASAEAQYRSGDS